jgi:hypothetical protein
LDQKTFPKRAAASSRAKSLSSESVQQKRRRTGCFKSKNASGTTPLSATAEVLVKRERDLGVGAVQDHLAVSSANETQRLPLKTTPRVITSQLDLFARELEMVVHREGARQRTRSSRLSDRNAGGEMLKWPIEMYVPVYIPPYLCLLLTRDEQRERRWENRERSRRNAIERERAAQAHETNNEDRVRVTTRERLATWDDDREIERGRELFYVDR